MRLGIAILLALAPLTGVSGQNTVNGQANAGLDKLRSAISQVLQWYESQTTALPADNSDLESEVQMAISNIAPQEIPAATAAPQAAIAVSNTIPYGIVSIVGSGTVQLVEATEAGQPQEVTTDSSDYQVNDLQALETIPGIESFIGAYMPVSIA